MTRILHRSPSLRCPTRNRIYPRIRTVNEIYALVITIRLPFAAIVDDAVTNAIIISPLYTYQSIHSHGEFQGYLGHKRSNQHQLSRPTTNFPLPLAVNWPNPCVPDTDIAAYPLSDWSNPMSHPTSKFLSCPLKSLVNG